MIVKYKLKETKIVFLTIGTICKSLIVNHQLAFSLFSEG